MINGNKPLGQRAYGSIPHLPGSRRGPADKGISEQQASIVLSRTRDRHDTIIVQEKLDGSNCCVAKLNGEVLAITRAGYLAKTSPFEQHHLFDEWVTKNKDRFNEKLSEGERIAGEWIAQAHGTRYELKHEPFVVFDILVGHNRLSYQELNGRLFGSFVLANTFHIGGPLSIEGAMALMGNGGHGAIDAVEGAVWRCERKGGVDFVCKYVRQDKVDGIYLPELTGRQAVWNWRPLP